MISQKTFAKYAADPSAFRAELIVDVDGIPRKFGEVQDPWQKEDFQKLDPGLMACNGRSAGVARNRAYLERPRGHSKTTDLAVTCCWALAFATRPIRGYCIAADRDQASLLKDAIAVLVRLNPWLDGILDVQKNLVLNIAKGHPGAESRLEIFTSDVASSYGILPDLLISDELTHWQGDGSLWYSLISSAAKRSNCLLVVIANAGFQDSWQWGVREAARTDPSWIFSRLDGPQASWMTPARLAEQRRMLPAVAFARLWENRWSSSGGDAVTPEDIDAAFAEGYQPMSGSEPGYIFAGGIDLGLTRDCSAVVILGIPDDGRSGKIRLANARLWRPTLGKKINLTDVENHVLDMDRQFDLAACAFDPWQAEHLAQRLEVFSQNRRRSQRRVYDSKPWMREIPPTATNLRAQATLTIESFKDRRFQFYEYEPLRRDLFKLRVEEKSYGIRLTSPRDGEGHGDTASSFMLALLLGHELAGKKPIVAGAATFGGESGLTPIQRAIRSYEQQADEYESQAVPDSDPFGIEPWKLLMKHVGRN